MLSRIVILLFYFWLPVLAAAELDENWKRDAIKAAKIVPEKYGDFIDEAAWAYAVPHSVITGVIVIESLGIPNSVSHKEAKCLMQTKDSIGSEVGMPGNSCDPRESILRGTAYLARLRDHYGFDWLEAQLVAYNAGLGNAREMSSGEILDHAYIKKFEFAIKLGIQE